MNVRLIELLQEMISRIWYLVIKSVYVAVMFDGWSTDGNEAVLSVIENEIDGKLVLLPNVLGVLECQEVTHRMRYAPYLFENTC